MRGWLLFLLLAVAGCGSSPPAGVVTRSDEPYVVRIQGEDARLNEARRKAQATLSHFMEALQSDNKTLSRFSIKAEFAEEHIRESLWLRDIRPEGPGFVGTLANRPIQLRKLELGQRIQVKSPAVTDWMYIDGDNLVGGYTIRVLAEGLTAEAREHLERKGRFQL